MKDFIFISDFDGTATAQDFFKQIIYRYKPEIAFSNSSKFGLKMLTDVFENLNLTEAEIKNEINHIPLDPNFVNLAKLILQLGFDFAIVSAGFKCYIEERLKFAGLENVKIIANRGCLTDGGIKYIEDRTNIFYSEDYGIDKLKVVKYFKSKFKTLAYAGDSKVDFEACRFCDIRFAKSNLAKIFDIFFIKYSKFKNFSEIKNILYKKFESIN